MGGGKGEVGGGGRAVGWKAGGRVEVEGDERGSVDGGRDGVAARVVGG